MAIKLKILIPEPCTQKWTDMVSAQNGRYCQQCEKEVVDFTKMTSEELKSWFTASNGKVCGRIIPSQLEEFDRLSEPKNKWNTAPIKLLVAACLTVVTNLKSNASTVSQTIYPIGFNKSVNDKQKTVKDIALIQSDSLIRIKGIVKDSEDKSPVPGASIKIKNSDLVAITNDKGEFSLEVPNQKGNITLIFQYLGYITVEKNIPLNQNNIEVLITADQAVLGGIGVIIERRHSNFFLNLGMIVYYKARRILN
jgi:hypothetical protein